MKKIVIIILFAILFSPDFVSAQSISAGMGHALVMCKDKTVWGWGDIEKGELGAVKQKESTQPIKISGLSNVKSIAAGGGYSLVLKNDGTVWWSGICYWYHNDVDSRRLDKYINTFVQQKKLTGITAIVAGCDYSLALKNDSTVWAWGMNNSHVIANSNSQPVETPEKINGLSGVIAIAAGGAHVLALKKDGSLWTWGNNRHLQLGFSDGGNRESPELVNWMYDIKAIAAGAGFSIVLKNDGTVWTWGSNSFGQMGNGSNGLGEEYANPQPVQDLTEVTAIAAGVGHSLALKKDGTVWAWGLNNSGELGSGDKINSNIPLKVTGLIDIIAISTSGEYSIALKKDGTLWAWGYNIHGVAGSKYPETRSISIPVRIGKTFNITKGS